MADDKKSNKSIKAAKAAQADIARRIWLAGVGAYGQAYAGVQAAAGRWADQAGASFDELVARGEALEEEMRAALATDPNGKKVAALMDDAAKKTRRFGEEQRVALESRLADVRKSLGDTLAPFNVAALAQSVEALNARVEALSAEVVALKALKPEKPKKAAAPKAKAPAA